MIIFRTSWKYTSYQLTEHYATKIPVMKDLDVIQNIPVNILYLLLDCQPFLHFNLTKYNIPMIILQNNIQIFCPKKKKITTYQF